MLTVFSLKNFSIDLSFSSKNSNLEQHLSRYVFAKNDQSGKEPVREWLKSLPKQEKKIIGEDMMAVQYGWPLGMPLVRNLGNGLWEVRINLENRIARVIFFIHNHKMVLVHGFIKKSQQTPKEEIEALKRKTVFLK